MVHAIVAPWVDGPAWRERSDGPAWHERSTARLGASARQATHRNREVRRHKRQVAPGAVSEQPSRVVP